MEALEPVEVELRVFDVGVMGFDFDMRIEFQGCFFGDLEALG